MKDTDQKKPECRSKNINSRGYRSEKREYRSEKAGYCGYGLEIACVQIRAWVRM